MAKRAPKKVRTPEPLPYLRHLESLVLDGHGDITIGRAYSIPCAATAADEDRQVAALVHREGETLADLLIRLDKAIERAYEHDQFIDEISNGPDYSI